MPSFLPGHPTLSISGILRIAPLPLSGAAPASEAEHRPRAGETARQFAWLVVVGIGLAAGATRADPPLAASTRSAEAGREPTAALDAAKLSAAKAKSSHNMKMILLALTNYEAANGCFPPAVVHGPDGRPWHSWRVLILPFLEGGPDVYRAYDFSRPWDSEPNLAVARRRIAAYRSPFDEADSGAAGYAVILSDDGVFPPAGATMRDANDGGFRARGTKLGDIRDGVSSTACLVPIDADAGTTWTEPKDMTPLTQRIIQTFPGTGPDQNEYVYLGLCDGSIRMPAVTVDDAVLRALTSRAGGERIDLATWSVTPGDRRARMPAKDQAAGGMKVLDPSDPEAVRRAMGGRVTVEAVVHSVGWTAKRDAVNIELVGPDDDRLLVWLNPDVTAKLAGGAVDPARDELTGRRLLVTGLLGPYGGRSKRLEGRKQLTVDSPADIAFAEPGRDEPGK